MKRNAILVIMLICLSLLGNTAFANVGYLGPAGTYTEEATIQFFGQGETITPVSTVAESLAMLKSGKCEYAVVPIENTIGGPVYNYLDGVVADDSFTVVGEVDLPIRQTLLALPGATIPQIKTIMSHPQGIAQSKAWMKANTPDATIVEVSSTAEAAKKVAESGDTSMAAIAASRTAEVYNLNILATDLQYTNTNVTRFWIVTLKAKHTSEGNKASILVNGSINSVVKLLCELEKKGYAVQSLHDRPLKTKMGEYQFVIEVVDHKQQNSLENILARKDLQLQIRILGKFNSK
ncbi:prephenate dehydratase [Pelosinus sp. sgz500959]|uniref:prephenate dehydratase n=1 Tax=Pelosinus sp. sgz500959 TaxID=3242472 RepID=UPI003672BF5F